MRNQKTMEKRIWKAVMAVFALALILTMLFSEAEAQNTVIANVVVFDTPIMFNRLGAQNPNWITYALERDVVPINPLLAIGPGNAQMRKDKRIRPLVLRVNEGDYLQVNFKNWLTPVANQFVNPDRGDQMNVFLPPINDQVAGRFAGFHIRGLQLVGSTASDSSNVGQNISSLVPPGGETTYTYYAPPGSRGAYLADSYGATFGSEATSGNTGQGMFAAVNVEPAGARWYRSQVTEEEMRLAATDPTTGLVKTTADGQPIINYEATYPNIAPWIAEGKANKPILNMLDGNIIFHSDLNAIIVGPNTNGTFLATNYPLESVGKRNPAIPNRLEPFREFTSIFHDENSVAQAFPGFFNANLMTKRILHGVRDTFMINYGSGGIGSEIIANRLGVGPMWDCLTCSYEEFFLASSTVGDPAMLVDVPANVGLENCDAGLDPNACAAVGPKATKAFYPDDPANVHHSYQNDRVVFRNVHAGKEHHIFHLHNHQWLFDPNDDNSNLIDAQAVGPGSGYTYEINWGGSGNRHKSVGDAIYHCHFYPHFAQGMWKLWRIHDVYETGTRLAASNTLTGFHDTLFGLFDGTPAQSTTIPGASVRSLPDGEILVGTPIPAVVPLPGKALPVMPGEVVVVAKNVNPGVDDDPITPGIQEFFESSQVHVVDRTKNPGYPFWIAGVDCGGPTGIADTTGCRDGVVGQRPPTPPLDMLTETQATALRTANSTLFGSLNSLAGNQNGGWDGGLPRHALDGFTAVGGRTPDVFHQEQTKFSFAKEIFKAKPAWYPEGGTDLEQLAMRFHAQKFHNTYNPDGTSATEGFRTNGAPPQAGAPFSEPCIDDKGQVLFTNVNGSWFNSDVNVNGGFVSLGTSPFNATNPRVYKGANVQIDAVLNKKGHHYPQQRIVSLWEDVTPFINKTKAPEPLVMRNNTLDCTRYLHTNLVPNRFEVDDYQVTTPTDIIGQHIHLPKWDLPAADGSANGWNYEDGTLSPGSVRERIRAINTYNPTGAGNPSNSTGTGAEAPLAALSHPFFGNGTAINSHDGQPEYLGARTTIQRWFFDPVLNVHHVDRGLGMIFTHDHFGPSTFQQVGLYASVLVEPKGSRWVHNETSVAMYTRPDGGPTSWQAAILPQAGGAQFEPFREFFFQHSDFQHAYEAGVYIGAGPTGRPNGVLPDANSFRTAINPSVRQVANPTLPDLVLHPATCLDGTPRPCPEAISADDPGFIVVNYRNEPVGWRIYDPLKIGPDGKPGMQADGLAGDLAFALQSRADRMVRQFGTRLGDTPYPPLTNDINNGDPFTPMMRAYAGDLIRIKSQAGGDEHEHNFSIHGVKWLQGGSGHGRAPNSGWRSAQHRGISEQFTFAAPIVPFVGGSPTADYAYSHSAGTTGWWSGAWGILRTYNQRQPRQRELFSLPTTNVPVNINNANQFNGVCPTTAPVRRYDITAVLANDVLPNDIGAFFPDNLNPTDNVGGTLNNLDGGTLVYNPRNTLLAPPPGLVGRIPKSGPLHDPTAMLYVRTEDLVFDPAGTKTIFGNPVGLQPNAPVEPIVLRANAGECVEVTLRNALLEQAIDGNGLPVVDAAGNPVFLNLGQTLFVNQGGLLVAATQPVAFDKPPDLAGYNLQLPVVPRDQIGLQGVTWFDNNLIRPSSYAGITPQLVAVDVTRDDGTVVGQNPPGNQVVAPGLTKLYRWYAGDVSPIRSGNRVNLVPTPIEFGGANLMPADKIKQGQKGLVGALSIGPIGSIITEIDMTWDHQQTDQAVLRKTRASGNFGNIRDFALVFQKGLNLRYADGTAVEQIAAEGLGIPEDSVDSGHAAINYGTEPMWFRFGLQADVPFGNLAPLGGGLGDVANPEMAYSNLLTGGDPATPVFTAAPGDPVRMHILFPSGTDRGSVFHLHGHLWQRTPYICQGQNDGLVGLDGKCNWTDFGAANFNLGSTSIGVNPIAMYGGSQESVVPTAHFDIVLPGAGSPIGGAGGFYGVPGDYLFRDQGSFGNTNGLWGILRVGP